MEKSYRNINSIEVKRNEIWMADVGEGKGSVQRGVRPVVILQNNKGNMHSPCVNVACITSSQEKSKLPVHILIGEESGMLVNSIILCEQQFTLNKKDLIRKVGKLTELKVKELDRALKIQYNLLDESEKTNYISELKTKQTKKVDFLYIQECLDNIKEMKDLYENYKTNSTFKAFKIAVKELVRYCKECNKDEKMYLRKYEYLLNNIEKAIVV